MTTTTQSIKAALPLDVARSVAQRLIAELSDVCERVEVAGSIRRGNLAIGDIEIVAIPKLIELPTVQQIGLFGAPSRAIPGAVRNLLEDRLQQMITDGLITNAPPLPGLVRGWGARYKKAWLHIDSKYGWVQLDLFLATAENWGAIYTIRTGCGAFSRALVTYARIMTPYRQSDGSLVDSHTTTPVSTPSERAYFATLGVPWIAPEKRSAAAAGRLYARIGQGRRFGVMDDAEARAFIRARLEGRL